MADLPSSVDAAGQGPDPAVHPGMPRWAKTLVIGAGAALLVALVLMHALGDGMGNH
ncbi:MULTISPECIES: hypothetical protein [unclassified Streptomyces]|uniref:hypothetical protein n=1 Tax=unclassified Streptomyces TaxID=2593676 RepID=UPI00224E199E|nr:MULTISPECIES: hypothetical protein [unclassified Streptomyces]MCX5328667.1 hypothetical protein [Streptomyces sp. NBC_00140]MCX5358080.1 hypothetical protein [Streptomyces sp. NBC_00124]